MASLTFVRMYSTPATMPQNAARARTPLAFQNRRLGEIGGEEIDVGSGTAPVKFVGWLFGSGLKSPPAVEHAAKPDMPQPITRVPAVFAYGLDTPDVGRRNPRREPATTQLHGAVAVEGVVEAQARLRKLSPSRVCRCGYRRHPWRGRRAIHRIEGAGHDGGGSCLVEEGRGAMLLRSTRMPAVIVMLLLTATVLHEQGPGFW